MKKMTSVLSVMVLLTSFNTFAAKASKSKSMQKKISAMKIKAERKVASKKSLSAPEVPFCPPPISSEEKKAQLEGERALSQSTASMEQKLIELKKEAAKVTGAGLDGNSRLSEQQLAEVLKNQQSLEEAAALEKQQRQEIQASALKAAQFDGSIQYTEQEIQEMLQKQIALEEAAQAERKRLQELQLAGSLNKLTDVEGPGMSQAEIDEFNKLQQEKQAAAEKKYLELLAGSKREPASEDK